MMFRPSYLFLITEDLGHIFIHVQYIYFNVQKERTQLRDACTAKDSQIAALNDEMDKVSLLRAELMQAKVSEMI